MRILHVLSAEFFAGSVAYAVQLAEAHRAQGHSVWMAARRLLATGWLQPDEKILLLNTGNGQKYLENVLGRAQA